MLVVSPESDGERSPKPGTRWCCGFTRTDGHGRRNEQPWLNEPRAIRRAVRVSHNLGIPFACLKYDMTDTTPLAGVTCPDRTGTGPKALNLGASIQALKPTMTKSDVKNATKTATHQAHTDIHGSYRQGLR